MKRDQPAATTDHPRAAAPPVAAARPDEPTDAAGGRRWPEPVRR